MNNERPEEQEMDADHTDYKYEVAFSFLSEDEAQAAEINDMLKDRMLTFLYSERQRDVVKPDGITTFSRVFGKESRLVVVLYRDKWGETQWTRIERTAIEGRFLEQGSKFLLFIPLDNSPLPVWLPKTDIWFNLERFGPAGAAAVIEDRVREAGNATRPESVADYAARLSRQAAAEESRAQFLASPEGVQAALAEVKILLGMVETLAKECDHFKFNIDCGKTDLDVYAKGSGTLLIVWHQLCSNTLHDSYLQVRLLNGPPTWRGNFHVGEEPRIFSEKSFAFDRDSAGRIGWRSTSDNKLFLMSDELAQECLKMLMQYVHEHRTNSNTEVMKRLAKLQPREDDDYY